MGWGYDPYKGKAKSSDFWGLIKGKRKRGLTKTEAPESLEISSGTPKPRGAEPAMSKARVKGEKTSLMGKSKMSLMFWP